MPISTRAVNIALAGNPNTGKSTVFNALTGFRQRVGNYPGVTVEKRVGALRFADPGLSAELIDLPGAYSLGAHGEDEAVVLDVLLGRQESIDRIDLIVVVIDASHLSRNLFLTTQLLELGRPLVVALNMIDLARAAAIEIDVAALQEELGVPVVPVSAKKHEGIAELLQAIENTLGTAPPTASAAFPPPVQAEIDGLIATLEQAQDGPSQPISRAETIQTLLDPGGYHEQRLSDRMGATFSTELAERRRRIEQAGESVVEVEASVRYALIDNIIARAVRCSQIQGRSISDRIDRILTHRVLGLILFLLVMASCFQAVYTGAAPLMDSVDATFAAAGTWISTLVPPGAVQSLLVDGVLAGVGAVLVFLPQILILFLFIAVLEDCGYMARAAFLLDRWMGLIGLNGKSFIPLLSSFACAVPGIMATRTIDNRRERFVTILIAPLMSCSARLPVYTLLIGAFVPGTMLLGGFVSLRAVTLLGLYLVGIAVAIPIALLLKRTLLSGVPQSFLLELPSYKRPSVRIVLYRVYEQGREFCVSAGTIIFAVTVVVWALGYYPRSATVAAAHDAQRATAQATYERQLAAIGSTLDPVLDADGLRANQAIAAMADQINEREISFEQQVSGEDLAGDETAIATARRAADADIEGIVSPAGKTGDAARSLVRAQTQLNDTLTEIERSLAGTYLRQSVLGRMGRWIEPIVRPLGWDWRIGTAVIASFPAREVVIATMGTIYNLGEEQDETSTGLREKLRAATWPDGKPVFNLAVALSIMVFFALCCQCAATLATIKRETHSWVWPLGTFFYMTTIAYVAAFVTYQLASRLV